MILSLDWPFGNAWVLVGAVALDLLCGEPPNRWHPVVAMGWLISALRKRSPKSGRSWPLLAGLGIIVLGITLSLAVGVGVPWLRDRYHWLGLAVEVLVLKMTFSVRALAQAATAVRAALAQGKLSEARRLLAWHLVSRDTATLDEARVAAATIESVVENASDSVVAPWLFYVVGGLPGALAYRFANTADAMLGYHDAEREWLGKIPARLDDVFNWLPARLTAVFVMLAAPWVGGNLRRGLAIWWRDANKTLSPNAGQPMAAAAGVLGLELEKVGNYRLGAGERLPNAADIGRAVRVLYVVAGLALAVAVGCSQIPRCLAW